jgi:hypothetical protein
VEFFAVLHLKGGKLGSERGRNEGLGDRAGGDLMACNAYLVSYYGTARCPCVCCYLRFMSSATVWCRPWTCNAHHDAVVEYAPHDCRPCACGLW